MRQSAGCAGCGGRGRAGGALQGMGRRAVVMAAQGEGGRFVHGAMACACSRGALVMAIPRAADLRRDAAGLECASARDVAARKSHKHADALPSERRGRRACCDFQSGEGRGEDANPASVGGEGREEAWPTHLRASAARRRRRVAAELP
eukprot:357528-Chlamydomonas_euryale.AAC.4